jgi:hypothetical protein
LDENILAMNSLAETLWRLEEVKCGFRKESDSNAKAALDWVLSRQGLKGAYRSLFAPTETDVQGVKLITGEPILSAALRHILGEEALRTAIAWNRQSTPAAKTAISCFKDILTGSGEPAPLETGWFCCHKCTIAFLRTLTMVKPEGWKTTLQRGIENIKRKRTPDSRWHGFPFYYTLLFLSEVDLPSAKAELKHASAAAKKVLNRYPKADRVSRFRKIGLDAAMNARDS